MPGAGVNVPGVPGAGLTVPVGPGAGAVVPGGLVQERTFLWDLEGEQLFLECLERA